jgi:MFS family permease
MELPPARQSPGPLLTAGLTLLATAIAFEGLAVPTVLPATLDELGGLTLYGWTFSGYWLTSLVGIVVAGIESDRRGPLRPFAVGVVLNAGGLVVAATASSMLAVAAGRAVQGLGSGAIGALIYVAVARGYAPAEQPRMIAVISSAWVLPGLVGPLIAGIVTETFGWRWVFGGLAPLVPLAAAVLFMPLGRLHAKAAETAAATNAGMGDAGTARLRDALQLTVGSALVLAAPTQPLPVAVGLGVIGLAVAARALTRLLPEGSLLARPGRGAAIAALGLVSVAFLGAEAFVPLAVASVRGGGPILGGLALTSAAITWAAGSWIQARLAARGWRQWLVVTGFGLVMAGIGLETWVPLSAAAPIWLAAVAWGIAGLGMGLAYSTATLVVIETAARGAEGAASVAIELAVTLGIAIGTGVAGATVAAVAAGPGLAPGIVLANLAMIVAAAIGLLAARRVPDAPPSHPQAVPLADRGPVL